MLANGATLGYKTTGNTYTNLPGLKEIPDLGVEPEKVENTCLTDGHKTVCCVVFRMPALWRILRRL